jgi:hypothetical protein
MEGHRARSIALRAGSSKGGNNLGLEIHEGLVLRRIVVRSRRSFAGAKDAWSQLPKPHP